MLIIIFIVSSISETKDTILVDKTTFCGVHVYLFFKYHKKNLGSLNSIFNISTLKCH